MTRRSFLIAAAWLGSMVSIVAMLVFSVQAESDGTVDGGLSAFAVAVATLTASTASTGWLLVARRPGNRVGLLLASGATLLSCAFLGFGVAAARSTVFGTADIPGGIAALFGLVTIIPAVYLTVPVATLLFPDGRLPSHAWRWPAGATAIAVALGSIGTLVSRWTPIDGQPDHPMPLLPTWIHDAATSLSTIGLICGMVLAVAAIVVRYRRAAGQERAQMKWLLAGLSVAAVMFPVSWTTDIGPDDGALVDILSVVALGLVPLAIVIAVLRYRLYEIDRLVSRTITYGLVTAILFGVFTGFTVVMSSTVSPTGGNALTTAVATLIVAALFNPLRRRVQQVVDRRFNRARYDAQQTASGFADRLRHQLDLPMLSAELQRATIDSVEPHATAVWLRPRGSR